MAAIGVEPEAEERRTCPFVTSVTSATWADSDAWDAFAMSSTFASASSCAIRSSRVSFRSISVRSAWVSSRLRAVRFVFTLPCPPLRV